MSSLVWDGERWSGAANKSDGRIGIKELKKRIPIHLLLKHFGVTIVRGEPLSQDWVSIKCPFHHDQQASASVNYRLNRFRCHACDMAGDIVDLVEEHFGLNTKGAMDWLTTTFL